MKRIVTVAVLSTFAVAGLRADDRSTNVRMKASGDSLATTISLIANSVTDEEKLAGDGPLGSFTYHGLRADLETATDPVDAAACNSPVFVSVAAVGSGVFRF